ncbi:MAG: hypothetical protein GY775_12085 [Candidatus Scalindua sp.]|nr:hypothetical protein [Candidatus Scalindua sp.]
MNTYFAEKQIIIKNKIGEEVKFFMRPIKVKELKIINRVNALAENADAEEFTTPLLLSLMLDCLSIEGSNIPVSATKELIDTFIGYNFPEIKEEKKFEESDRSKTKKKKKVEPLSFFIDFLVNQGHTVAGIMEMTLPQFNELCEKAGERLHPEAKVMDPLEAFKKMGLPIRKRGNNGR